MTIPVRVPYGRGAAADITSKQQKQEEGETKKAVEMPPQKRRAQQACASMRAEQAGLSPWQ
jgi:hypothetical protein